MSDYPKNIKGSFAIQTAIKGTAVQPDWNITNPSAEGYIKNKPTIPTAQIISKWGFYSKPNGGIPKNDLASDVQTSLGNADTAVQPSVMNKAIADAITTTLNTPV